ncbi:MAG: thymidine phosphorylase [Candidatus Marinimicrobia bacterium]|nr:thymidine phosphorylase [Candidatus Neomarinimicrobiota bacterium]
MNNFHSLVQNKNNSQAHTNDQISFIVNSYLQNKISDSEMTKWLKAVYENGMNITETVFYTNSIIQSGQRIVFDNIDGFIIDKHSTGGVGDKVSLILGPILAACGCYVPMIVGRHLGHTGGTLDKLESIPGYDGLISSKRFKQIVKDVGISIIGQTDEICPADRKIYMLRGKTDTVASFPLICGSIMGKKIAEGIQGLVLDIKIGNGAFIKDAKEANKLGQLLATIGSNFNVEVNYINSDMNQPLGKYSGLLCEIIESMEALQGRGDDDLMKVVFTLGELALNMANQNSPTDKMKKVISDGSAFEIFKKMVRSHGGNLNKVKLSYKNYIDIFSDKDCILSYNTKKLGDAINFITILNGDIDNNAGMQFYKKNGDYLKKGDKICRVFGDELKNIEVASAMISPLFNKC